MSKSQRKNSVNKIAGMHSLPLERGKVSNIDFYGEDVFNKSAIIKYLPKNAAHKLLDTIDNGTALDPEISADVAHGMKQWAMERGATHYSHWFQPMTGSTAEKHDSFLEPVGDKAIFSFSASRLIVGEPDASSFPSGGIRHTFEARGYTAWDPTSPAFIKRHANGATLCIPTIFYSYTGEALDKKTPLLRSIQALRAAIKRLMKCFDQPEAVPKVYLGPEQEYFLIDKQFYLGRPDLLQTGRTLFGTSPAKHQQLEDHYFGSIRQRILNFMSDVEDELWRLGIPAKTRHNEVAPAQFELASVFEELNLAVDHNMITMDVLKQVADRHGLVCLLHEKPFSGVNGSGKHCNWSMGYGGMNLLDPGNDPHQNAIFLTTLCCIIAAVDKNAEMLRMTVSGAGNDHRLGANEAPPAIISIFLGEQLNDIIAQIEAGTPKSCRTAPTMRVGVDLLPPLPMDVTDRNRTSPFAFTGNKFEFRAPGSSQSCAGPMTVLNTIVASAMDKVSEKLENLGEKDFNNSLQKILQEIIHKHKKILFNGDGYTEEWKLEAARRGLPNATTTMEALRIITAAKNVEFFERYGVYTRKELESRFEIFMEEYHSRIRIEGQVSLEIARTMIIPAVTEEYHYAVSALKNATVAGVSAGVAALKRSVEIYGGILDELSLKTENMAKAVKGLHEEIIAAMNDLRITVDSAERLISDDKWPLPKYREMLFIY